MSDHRADTQTKRIQELEDWICEIHRDLGRALDHHAWHIVKTAHALTAEVPRQPPAEAAAEECEVCSGNGFRDGGQDGGTREDSLYECEECNGTGKASPASPHTEGEEIPRATVWDQGHAIGFRDHALRVQPEIDEWKARAEKAEADSADNMEALLAQSSQLLDLRAENERLTQERDEALRKLESMTTAWASRSTQAELFQKERDEALAKLEEAVNAYTDEKTTRGKFMQQKRDLTAKLAASEGREAAWRGLCMEVEDGGMGIEASDDWIDTRELLESGTLPPTREAEMLKLLERVRASRRHCQCESLREHDVTTIKCLRCACDALLASGQGGE